MQITELQNISNEASAAYRGFKNALDAKLYELKREAEKRIQESLSGDYAELQRLAVIRIDAEVALEDAQVAQSKKLGIRGFREGDRVTRRHNVGDYRYSRYVTQIGILEVATRDTMYPDNTGDWRKPSPGEFIVRICTKDGKPGKKFEVFNSQWLREEREGK